MKLLLYGVSHQTVSSDDAKKYRLSHIDIEEKLSVLKSFDGIDEVVILSNQDRTEFYLHVDEKKFSHGKILKFISGYSGEGLEQVIMESYNKFNEDVVRHLLFILSEKNSLDNQEMNILECADDALYIASECGASGIVLGDLFEQAISFSLHMRALPIMRVFYHSALSKTLRRLLKEWNSLDYKRFYLTGKSPFTLFMSKALFYLGASSITIETGDEDSQQLANQLNEWATRVSCSSFSKPFHSGDTSSIHYQMSSADGIIVEENAGKIAGVSKELEEILTLRFTKKKQLFISMLAQSIPLDHSLKEKGIRAFSFVDLQEGEIQEGINEEEKEAAQKKFEESIDQEVEKLLANYHHTLTSVFLENIQKKSPVFSTYQLTE